MSNRLFKVLLPLTFIALALQSCSSAKKQRLEEREKLSASTGFYCQFVNGDQFQDFDVVLNLEMAKRCDTTKNFTVNEYKSAADIHGLVYCCNVRTKDANPATAAKMSVKPKAAAKPAEGKTAEAKTDGKTDLSEKNPGKTANPEADASLDSELDK